MTPFLPQYLDSYLYVEPFLGAGSLYFSINPSSSVISDINSKLIDCYNQIKKNPYAVYFFLSEMVKADSKENYYAVRESFNDVDNKVLSAAQFIYLNKASFNGIYRVNKKGEYNVPYGYIKSLSVVDLSQLLEISNYMKSTEIKCCSFEETDVYADKMTFYYLDPPYPPINETSFFTHYTKDRFGESDQLSLKYFADKISDQGAKVMMTNADLPGIRDLYSNWKIDSLSTVRWVSSKKNKYKISELVIRNY